MFLKYFFLAGDPPQLLTSQLLIKKKSNFSSFGHHTPQPGHESDNLQRTLSCLLFFTYPIIYIHMELWAIIWNTIAVINKKIPGWLR